ncbi:MAG: zinc ribbon domain-containing protein [Candidatus Methanomethylophilus sp.]|nr:zinc ribbon domain-containing protein [Methanomethylophilus sp.]
MTEGAQNKRYCLECGGQVEPGADFCYTCGSRRVIDVDPETNRVVMQKGHCPYCGRDNDPDATFCGNCGKRIGDFEYVGDLNRPLTAKDFVIMLVTLLPGAFNLFGLGHILLKRYSRAFVYLIISAVLIYMRLTIAGASMSTLIIIEVIGLVVYLKQAMEVFGLLYGPREQ